MDKKSKAVSDNPGHPSNATKEKAGKFDKIEGRGAKSGQKISVITVTGPHFGSFAVCSTLTGLNFRRVGASRRLCSG